MYSHDINNIMRSTNYNIDSKTYSKIIAESSQVDHVKYSPYGNYFEIWTTDNYYWKFNVYYKGD